MKITKSQLREIIREEIQTLNERKEPNIDGAWIKSVLSKNGVKFKSIKRTWFRNNEAEYTVKLAKRSDEDKMYDALESAGWLGGGKSKTSIFAF